MDIPEQTRMRFQAPEKKKRRSERGDLIEYFTEKVNQDRRGTKYKPVSVKFIAVKTSHLCIRDLYYLKSICDEAGKKGNFSKVFYGSMKPRDPNDF